MDIIDLINRLRDNNIDLSLSGNDLEINYDGEALSETILGEIKYNKPGIVNFLKRAGTGKEMDIRIAPLQQDYPVSSSQRRLWILSHLDESNTVYSLPEMHVFEGDFNPRALMYAFSALVERHEILRTVFRESEEGEVRQVIHSATGQGFRLIYEDLCNDPGQDKILQDKIHTILRSPFNLATGPLLRAGLFRMTDDKWMLAYVMHHIISDGWSMQILVRELMLLYNAWLCGTGNPLPPLKIQYKDYSVWQQEQLAAAAMDVHKDYWLSRFEAEPEVLDLQADKLRPAIKTYHGAVAVAMVNPALSDALKACCRKQGCTLFMGMLAVINALFYRYTGQEDITLGSPAAGRDHTDLENQIGFYINTLALRTQFSGKDTFEQLLLTVKEVTLGAYEHQLYPFDELVTELNLKRDMSRNPLFDIMVVMQNARGFNENGTQPINEIKISRHGRENETVSKFDITFDFVETNEGIRIEMEYCTDLFTYNTIERLGMHMIQLMQAAVHTPFVPIQELNYLSPEESQQLIYQFNDTQMPYRQGRTLVNLFEEQVAKSPSGIAVVSEEENISFDALNKAVNRFAHYLRKQYVIQPDDLIAVKLERGKWQIITLLAILKSGAGYIPIDPAYPQERIDYMLQDSCCKALIDEQEIAVFTSSMQQWEDYNLPQINTSQHLAYAIYTSGSTGRPKGCLLEHEGIINRITWMWEHYHFSTEDIILQKTTFTFDVSVWEIFMPLCFGAKMVLCSGDIIASPERLLSLIAAQQITCLHFVPGILQYFISALFAEKEIPALLSSLRCVFASGEALTKETVIQWYNKMEVPLHNLYGPTEASVDVTHYTTTPDDTRIPIGRPIWNTQIYILDKAGMPTPVGVAGQICIGGTGLARGYLNQPELTNQKFIPDAFREGQRIYKTGDLGKWLPDGNVEFLGRIDTQVKIRGLRIEPGEIEGLLKKYEQLDAAIVITRLDEHTDVILVAYLVSKGEKLDIQGIRTYLAKYLPAYMLPQYYVQLDKLPLNANGKTDHKQLPDPVIQTRLNYVPPGNYTEEKLADIWQELLGKEPIGITEDFFGLGGHSLKAIRLASRIYKTFNVKLGLKELLEKTILRDQADYITKTQKAAFIGIPPAAIQSDYPLSSSQQRLWLSCQFDMSNIAYNIPGVYLLEGKPDKAAFDRAFHMLLERHESLRTAFRKNEKGEVRQFILSPEEIVFNIKYMDPGSEQTALSFVREACLLSFDLSAPPLLRVLLIKIAEEKWILNFVIHHIVSDGWSMNILLKELRSFYNSGTHQLPPLKIHYKDYAVWQQEQLSAEEFNTHRNYWLKQFDGELPVIELLGDKPRPPVKTYNGAAVTAMIDTGLTAQLKELTSQQGSTLFMGLLASVNTLLYRYTSQEDIIIGCPIAGREHIDLEDQIGLYLNTLALRTRFKGTDNYLELLGSVRRTTTGAYNHQAYPFDVLVDELSIPRDVSRNALFDVVVEWQQGDHAAQKEQDDLKIFEYRSGEIELCKFDLYFKFIERGPEIELLLHYNSDIYAPDTIRQMAKHTIQLMAAALHTPDQSIRDLKYLSPDEIHYLLYDVNATAKNYPSDKTVVALFEEQVLRTPDNIALVFEKIQLDYKTLNERINQLANYLIEHHNISADTLVAVLLDPSPEMIIAIFAVLKAGGAYVPVDPELPVSRMDFLLKDTGAAILLTTSSFLPVPEGFNAAIVYIDQPLEAAATNPGVNIALNDLAYVIYTSGSTGLPKGVMISHASLVDYYYGITDNTNIRDCRTFALASTLAADLGNTVIYTALLIGGTIRLYPRSVLMDPEKMFEEIPDLLKIVPSHWKSLQTTGKVYMPEKCLIMGGEPLTPDIISLIRNNGGKCHVYNHYGPTEVTIGKVINNVNLYSDKPVSLGIPFCRSAVYVLDEQYNLTPPGVTGEICISGTGLARGYINRPELTAQKFLPNPFQQGERMYKTGDLGRWLADGTLDFQGRRDDQVKVRGYRIELGEIETALRSHTDIDASFVRIRAGKNKEKELIAYIVSRKILTAVEIRDYLTLTLPAYMIPAHFVALEHLPLTPNGKVDRKRLPEPEESALPGGTLYIAPSSDTERKLMVIWEEVLDRKNIGIRDDYFMLGGNSLKVISIIKKMQDKTGVAVPVRIFFRERTIETIAAYIAEATVEASWNQLTFLSGWKQGNPLVITPYEYEVLDITAFRLAVQQLTSRHEILRTKFIGTDGRVLQQIVPADTFYIDITDPVDVASAEELEIIIENAHARQLDPFTSALILIETYRLYNGRYLVLLTMHHALTDGYSDGIIQQELAILYIAAINKKTALLPPLNFQYKDFCNWQKDFLHSSAGRQHQAYWLKRLEGFKQNAPGNYSSADKSVCISSTIDKEITHFASKNGITPAGLLIGALSVMVSRLTGLEDVFLLVTVSGRRQQHPQKPDVSGLIGYFANALIVRSKINRTASVLDCWLNIQDGFLNDLQHDEYPVGKLIRELPGVNADAFLDTGIFFNYHNYAYLSEHDYNRMQEETIEYKEQLQMPLGLVIKEYRNCLKVEMMFDQRRFDLKQAKEIHAYFSTMLKQSLADPQIKVEQFL